eukprot:5675678-Amphidinium_carterae.1
MTLNSKNFTGRCLVNPSPKSQKSWNASAGIVCSLILVVGVVELRELFVGTSTHPHAFEETLCVAVSAPLLVVVCSVTAAMWTNSYAIGARGLGSGGGGLKDLLLPSSKDMFAKYKAGEEVDLVDADHEWSLDFMRTCMQKKLHEVRH